MIYSNQIQLAESMKKRTGYSGKLLHEIFDPVFDEVWIKVETAVHFPIRKNLKEFVHNSIKLEVRDSVISVVIRELNFSVLGSKWGSIVKTGWGRIRRTMDMRLNGIR